METTTQQPEGQPDSGNMEPPSTPVSSGQSPQLDSESLRQALQNIFNKEHPASYVVPPISALTYIDIIKEGIYVVDGAASPYQSGLPRKILRH